MSLSSFSIDRRFIYLLMIVGVSYPLITGTILPPPSMKAAKHMYELVTNLETKEGEFVFVAIDFGPNSRAENEPQTEVILEHLFRRHVPLVVFSQYALAEPLLKSIPERVLARLRKELPTENWVYGKDWVNIGYRPGQSLFLQGLAKSDSITEYLRQDADGARLKDFPFFAKITSIANVKLLVEVTGLVGVFGSYVQFFQREGFVPTIVHGCTSVTIPEAYIYLDSGQLKGLLEGAAGAASYSKLLTDSYPARPIDSALRISTALGVGHLLIIGLVILGNVVDFIGRRRAIRG